MEIIGNYAFQSWAVQFLTVLFFVGGLVTLAVGVGLIIGSAGMLRFFVAANRWVSTRRAFKAVEIARDTRQVVHKYRFWLAAIFVAGGAVSIFGLAMAFDPRAAGALLGLDPRPSFVASWLVESARWVLIVGNVVAIVVGVMLGFFPVALAVLETRGGRWFSDRQFVRGADAMNLSLDNCVAAFPRSAGWIITVAGLALVGDFGFMLLAVH